jgi:hypothetical protein
MTATSARWVSSPCPCICRTFKQPYGKDTNQEKTNLAGALMKELGLLSQVDGSHIYPDDVHGLPSNSNLFHAYLLSLSRLSGVHGIFVYRQSSDCVDFHNTYATKLICTAARSAIGLQEILQVEFQSLAVVSAQNCKGRIMPLFASDPATKMRLAAESNQFVGPVTAHAHKSLLNHCRIAARATHNITNQLLFAKINGLIPILVSMGTNGISSNWLRLSHFVCTFHMQYGHLDVVFSLRQSDTDADHRKDLSKRVAPNSTEYGGYGIALAQGQDNPGLAAWSSILEGHRKKATLISVIKRKYGGTRIR